MLILDAREIRNVLPMRDAVDAVTEAFRAYAARDDGALAHARMVPLGKDDGRIALKVGILRSEGAMTAKLNTLLPRRPDSPSRPLIQGLVILYDLETATVKAILDGGTITRIRTGAAAGAATAALARRDASIALVIGAGDQAADQIAALCAVRPIREVRVHNRHPGHGRAFCARMSEQFGIPVSWVSDVGVALRDADICVTITTSPDPVLHGCWLPPGIHINAVGAYKPDMRELDSALIDEARVVVDSREHCGHECGEIVMAAAELGVGPDALIDAEIGEILTGRHSGRLDDTEITVFKSVGLGIQDTAVAVRACQAARQAGIGREIAFSNIDHNWSKL